jgi:WD40 repeat protein
LDSAVIVWDAASGQLRAILRGHKHTVHNVAWSPDGKSVASGGYGSDASSNSISSEIIVWDVTAIWPSTRTK